MILIIAGTGPGEGRLLTLSAFQRAKSADVVIVPRSHGNTQGQAEKVITRLFPEQKIVHMTFPMTSSAGRRDRAILSQLEVLRPEWEAAQTVFFPVIGDSMLYSTGDYLLSAWRKLVPDIEVSFIPGVSAHSLAASCAKRFLAMRDEVFSVIPGTADREKIRRALSVCDCAAIYKPTAIRDILELAEGFRHVVRVDYAGIPGLEKVIRGEKALHGITEYMSVILLWKD